MRITVHLTLDGVKETVFEGESRFFSGKANDHLEVKGLGFWLDRWQYCTAEGKGTPHKGRAFVPWTSCLFVETAEAK